MMWSILVKVLSYFVLVMGSCAGDTNVALGKPAQQIDSWENNLAGQAVDGNREPIFNYGSCSHTDLSNSQWWVVDLLNSYKVNSIAITNRANHVARLHDFQVFVSDRDPRPSWFGQIGHVCFKHEGPVAGGGPHSFSCETPVIGRYVYVYKPTYGWLVMCEFEVLAEEAVQHNNGGLTFDEFDMKIGKKSVGKDPFYMTTINVQSGLKCVVICLSQKGGVATLIHFNQSTRRCECVERSRLNGEINYAVEEDWVTMEVTSNLTPTS